MVLQFMNRFDDFTINANKLFTDVKNALEQSEIFMNKVIDLKQKAKNVSPDHDEEYTGLIPELTELISKLKQTLIRAGEVEKHMKNLQVDWEKTKQNIS